MDLTREETIKAVEACKSEDCANCPLYEYESCVELREINVLHYLKEKEPAPSANGTSSEVKCLQDNDTTKKLVCQGIKDANQLLLNARHIDDDEKELYGDLGEAIGILSVLLDLTGGDDNV